MVVAGIDMGSNAIRITVAKRSKSKFYTEEDMIFKKRFPCRLGSDVFKASTISFEKQQQLDFIFQDIRKILDEYKVEQIKCVGTSAFRDSNNGEAILDGVATKYQIPIDIISGQDEAKYMSQGLYVRNFFEEPVPHLHADIGGGSLELSVFYKKKFIIQKSIDVGTLRLIAETRSGQLVQNHSESLKLINEILNIPEIQDLRFKFPQDIFFHGTGGNFRRLGRLRRHVLGRKKDYFLDSDEVPYLVGTFMNYSGYELAEHFPVREENAALIVPSLLIIQRILQFWPAEQIEIPKISLTYALLDSFYSSK